MSSLARDRQPHVFERAYTYLDGYPERDQSVIGGIYESTSVLSLTRVDAALADPR